MSPVWTRTTITHTFVSSDLNPLSFDLHTDLCHLSSLMSHKGLRLAQRQYFLNDTSRRNRSGQSQQVICDCSFLKLFPNVIHQHVFLTIASKYIPRLTASHYLRSNSPSLLPKAASLVSLLLPLLFYNLCTKKLRTKSKFLSKPREPGCLSIFLYYSPLPHNFLCSNNTVSAMGQSVYSLWDLVLASLCSNTFPSRQDSKIKETMLRFEFQIKNIFQNKHFKYLIARRMVGLIQRCTVSINLMGWKIST